MAHARLAPCRAAESRWQGRVRIPQVARKLACFEHKELGRCCLDWLPTKQTQLAAGARRLEAPKLREFHYSRGLERILPLLLSRRQLEARRIHKRVAPMVHANFRLPAQHQQFEPHCSSLLSTTRLPPVASDRSGTTRRVSNASRHVPHQAS